MKPRAKIDGSIPTLLCHLAFWFGVLCAIPTFIALNNPDDVAFRTTSLLALTGGAAILLSLLGLRVSSLDPGLRWWLNRIFLTVALVCAVQGNIVHDLFYYGAFNGERVDFRVHGWKFWLEWATWLAAFPLAFLLLTRLRRLPAWLPALPLVSFALLLLPALLAPRTHEAVASNVTVDDAVFTFSSVRNLVHLLPDGFQGDVVHQVFEENPDLAAEFQGFTLYTDHVGMYQGTAPAAYTLLTGKPFPLERGFDYGWVKPDIKNNSYPNELARNGYRVDYVPISGFICIEDADSCHARPFNDLKARGYFRHRSEDAMYSARLIADLTLFRLTPMFVKERIYDKGNWFLADTTLDGSSPWPDPVIREWTEHLRVVDDRPVYKWYHFIGTHIPAKWDADCSLLPTPSEERAAYVAQAHCVLESLTALLRRLKAAGIYDQTAFVISGDHGHNVVPRDFRPPTLNSGIHTGMLGSARPALLIKRLDSRAPLVFSTAPTHLTDIAPTALALAGIGTETPTPLGSGEEVRGPRKFRRYSIPRFWTGRPVPFVEFAVGSPAGDGSRWRVSAIEDYRKPPMVYEPLDQSTGNGFVLGADLRQPSDDTRSSWVTGRQLAIVIGVDDPAREYDLKLRLHIPEWLSGQAFTVEVNGGAPWQSPALAHDPEKFWQTVAVPLDIADQRAGRNFVSVVFEKLEHPPDTESWRGAALVQSVGIERRQARTHQ